MAKRFTRQQVGDWIKTQRGQLFEIVKVIQISAQFVGGAGYGPQYVGSDGQTALACAVVEVRPRPKRRSGGSDGQ